MASSDEESEDPEWLQEIFAHSKAAKKRDYLTLEEVLQITPGRETTVDFVHLGILLVLDKQRSGRFYRKELIKFHKLYSSVASAHGHLDFQAQFQAYCLAEDHEVLTNRGFMNLSAFLSNKQMQRAFSDECPFGTPGSASRQASRLRVAAYNPATAGLEYQPFRLIVNKRRDHQPMVEFVSHTCNQDKVPHSDDMCVGVDNGPGRDASLLVTPEHDMWVRPRTQARKPMDLSSFAKFKAGEILSDCFKPADISGHADESSCLQRSSTQPPSAFVNVPFEFQTCAPQGVTGGLLSSVALLSKFGLASEQHLESFLSLFGFWAGQVCDSKSSCSHRLPRHETLFWPDCTWLHGQLRRFNGHHDTHVCQVGSGSGVRVRDHRLGRLCATAAPDGRLPDWLWCLGQRHLMLVIEGMCQQQRRRQQHQCDRHACGVRPRLQAREYEFCTSCPARRDELIRLLFLSGHSVQCESRDGVYLVFSDGSGVGSEADDGSGEQLSCPQARSVSYSGRTWCVQVATGLIVVRRRAHGLEPSSSGAAEARSGTSVNPSAHSAAPDGASESACHPCVSSVSCCSSTVPSQPVVVGNCTLQLWDLISGKDGEQNFVQWLCSLLAESSHRAVATAGDELFVRPDAIKTLHDLLGIQKVYGVDFQVFIDLLEQAAEDCEPKLMDIARRNRLNDVIPIATIESFARDFMKGLVNMMTDLGFEPGMLLSPEEKQKLKDELAIEQAVREAEAKAAADDEEPTSARSSLSSLSSSPPSTASGRSSARSTSPSNSGGSSSGRSRPTSLTNLFAGGSGIVSPKPGAPMSPVSVIDSAAAAAGATRARPLAASTPPSSSTSSSESKLSKSAGHQHGHHHRAKDKDSNSKGDKNGSGPKSSKLKTKSAPDHAPLAGSGKQTRLLSSDGTADSSKSGGGGHKGHRRSSAGGSADGSERSSSPRSARKSDERPSASRLKLPLSQSANISRPKSPVVQREAKEAAKALFKHKK